MEEIKVGLLGFGTVGTGFVRLLRQNSTIIEERLDVKLTLKSVVCKNTKTDRGVPADPGVLASNAEKVLTDP